MWMVNVYQYQLISASSGMAKLRVTTNKMDHAMLLDAETNDDGSVLLVTLHQAAICLSVDFPCKLYHIYWQLIVYSISQTISTHEDVIKWKHFPRYWPFVRGIHRSPVNSPHKGQWRGALMFSLLCAWINGWVNNREAGHFRRHRAHYDVTVLYMLIHGCCARSRCAGQG